MSRFTCTPPAALCILICMLWSMESPAAEKKTEGTYQHQVEGLFSEARKADFRKAILELEGIELVRIDFDRAQVELRYDAKKLFGNAKPKDALRRLDNLVKSQSNHTFAIIPLRTIPNDQLKKIVIPVIGLDCKACSFGAYRAIYRIEGVASATASFKLGKVTARIDQQKTNRPALEAALKKRGVKIGKQPD